MPKPNLFPEQSLLEKQLIETMLAGLKRWRPDLNYPESHSDMQACVRAVMVMFKVERRPLPEDLAVPCSYCDGTNYVNIATEDGSIHKKQCPKCKNGKSLEFVGQ